MGVVVQKSSVSPPLNIPGVVLNGFFPSSFSFTLFQKSPCPTVLSYTLFARFTNILRFVAQRVKYSQGHFAPSFPGHCPLPLGYSVRFAHIWRLPHFI